MPILGGASLYVPAPLLPRSVMEAVRMGASAFRCNPCPRHLRVCSAEHLSFTAACTSQALVGQRCPTPVCGTLSTDL